MFVMYVSIKRVWRILLSVNIIVYTDFQLLLVKQEKRKYLNSVNIVFYNNQ